MKKTLLTVGLSTAVIFGMQAQETPTETEQERQNPQEEIIEARGESTEETIDSNEQVERTKAETSFGSNDMAQVNKADLPEEVMESFENSDFKEGTIERVYKIKGAALPQILESRANLSSYGSEQLPDTLYMMHVNMDDGTGILYFGDDGESIASEKINLDESFSLFGDAEEDSAEETEQTVENTTNEVEESAENVAQGAEETAEDVARGTDEAMEETGEEIDETATEIGNATEETAEDAAQATDEAMEETGEEIDETATEVGNAAEDAAQATDEAMEETGEEMEEGAAQVEESAEEAAQETEEAVEETPNEVEEGTARMEENADEAAYKTEEAVENTANEAKASTKEVDEEMEETADKAAYETEETVASSTNVKGNKMRAKADKRTQKMGKKSESKDMALVANSDLPKNVSESFKNSDWSKGTIYKAYKLDGAIVPAVLEERADLTIYPGEQLPEALYLLQIEHKDGLSFMYVGDDGEVYASEEL